MDLQKIITLSVDCLKPIYHIGKTSYVNICEATSTPWAVSNSWGSIQWLAFLIGATVSAVILYLVIDYLIITISQYISKKVKQKLADNPVKEL